LPVILEFQMPSTAITTTPVPRAARGIVWILGSMLVLMLAALGFIRVDRVVTAQARVVSKTPILMMQPLEASIVRSIDVHEGQEVQAGQVLARLDPTFAAADEGALAAQVATLQAQVSRLQAESDGRAFTYSGIDPDLSLQAAIYAERQSEYSYRIENYNQKISSLVAAIAKANADEAGYKDRLQVASQVETMRKDLEKMQVGSKLNTLAA
jgi:HlyD family secretion protein